MIGACSKVSRVVVSFSTFSVVDSISSSDSSLIESKSEFVKFEVVVSCEVVVSSGNGEVVSDNGVVYGDVVGSDDRVVVSDAVVEDFEFVES